jgi:hypothetical protein
MRSVGTWALLLAGGVAVGLAGFVPLSEIRDPSSVVRSPSAVILGQPRYAADSLGKVVVARDVFRVTRRSADVAYDPVRLAQLAATPAQPKPTLVLTGIVWTPGRDAAAVISGFPGLDGPRVLRLGEQAAGITVRVLSPAEVRLAGMDTTWVLRLRLP